MSDYIPLSIPTFQGHEWENVKECLDTNWVSSAGKYVQLFEKQIAKYTKSKYAIACVNGTSALQVSLRLAGVARDDEVIVPTLTFIAPINAISYNGAKPVFIDSDKYYNMDSNKAIEFIENQTYYKNGFTFNKITGKKISAIIPVHVWGNACWLDELAPLCKERNISMVEDASESLGTFYTTGKSEGKSTGTIGRLGCVSFNGNKIITTGGGGMILTDDELLAEKAWYLTTQAKDEPVRFIHNEIGYNFRLTNIQAALGVAQLEQLQGFKERRKKNYLEYRAGTKDIEGLKIADVPDYADNNHWMILLQIDKEIYGETNEELMYHLEKNGIQSRPVWKLNHMQLPYQNFQHYKIKKSCELLLRSLCLPSSSALNSNQIKKIIRILKRNK